MALLSVPLVFVRALDRELRPVFQLASVFLLAFTPLMLLLLHGLAAGGRATGRPRRDLPGASCCFCRFRWAWRCTMPGPCCWAGWGSARLYAHAQGWALWRGRAAGRPGATAPAAAWWPDLARRPAGRVLRCSASAAGLYFGDFGLLPFHLLLATGYGLVFYYSLSTRSSIGKGSENQPRPIPLRSVLHNALLGPRMKPAHLVALLLSAAAYGRWPTPRPGRRSGSWRGCWGWHSDCTSGC